MCLLCVQWEKDKLTNEEAFGAIGEMLSTEKDEDKIKHLIELSGKILDKESPFSEWDEDQHGYYIEGLNYDPETGEHSD